MKKVFVLFISIFALFGLTSCGSDGVSINSEYQKYIDAIRNSKMTQLYYEYSIGELTDNFIKKPVWDHYTKTIGDGNNILISVTGKNKENGNSLEIIYSVEEDSLAIKYRDIYTNGNKGGDYYKLLLKSAKELHNEN